MTGAVVAFIATLAIVGGALTLAFDSVAIAITPALVVAGIVAYSVYVFQTKRASRVT